MKKRAKLLISHVNNGLKNLINYNVHSEKHSSTV